MPFASGQGGRGKQADDTGKRKAGGSDESLRGGPCPSHRTRLGWIWGLGWTRLQANTGKLREYYKTNRDTLTVLFPLSLTV